MVSVPALCHFQGIHWENVFFSFVLDDDSLHCMILWLWGELSRCFKNNFDDIRVWDLYGNLKGKSVAITNWSCGVWKTRAFWRQGNKCLNEKPYWVALWCRIHPFTILESRCSRKSGYLCLGSFTYDPFIKHVHQLASAKLNHWRIPLRQTQQKEHRLEQLWLKVTLHTTIPVLHLLFYFIFLFLFFFSTQASK